MKAVIPAAGLGTRFLPATKAVPKEMLLVGDRPAIQFVVEEGLASEADEVVIVNSPGKQAIEDHFSPDPDLVVLLRGRGPSASSTKRKRWGLGMRFSVQQRRPQTKRSMCSWAMCSCQTIRCFQLCKRYLTPMAALRSSL